jgi:hypothetical protein
MGLILIIPVLAFDIWLLLTTGRRFLAQPPAPGRRRELTLMLCVGTALGIVFAFFAHYSLSKTFRIVGFPIPIALSQLEKDQWLNAQDPLAIRVLAQITDFISGFAVVLLPRKIGEFLDKVRQELKP